jgi:hypothetical protein
MWQCVWWCDTLYDDVTYTHTYVTHCMTMWHTHICVCVTSSYTVSHRHTHWVRGLNGRQAMCVCHIIIHRVTSSYTIAWGMATEWVAWMADRLWSFCILPCQIWNCAVETTAKKKKRNEWQAMKFWLLPKKGWILWSAQIYWLCKATAELFVFFIIYSPCQRHCRSEFYF